jgi:hypothetical protein
MYWAACVAAAGWLAFVLYLMSTSDRNDGTGQAFAIGFGGAALFWAFGRATRYVLSGK